MRGQYRNGDNPFELVKVYLPKSLKEILRKHSETYKIPMSHLIQIAIDNESEAPGPFSFPTPPPDTIFVELAYINEAQLIAKFMIKFPSGTTLTQLMLMRKDVGIPNKKTFMLAYRELLAAKVIEEISVPVRAKFKYANGTKYVRLVSIDRSALLKRKRRLFEKQRELLEAEEKEEEKLRNVKKQQYGVAE